MPVLDSETPLSTDHDAATRSDEAFNTTFRHGFTTIDGLQMHYVVGGDGPQPIVLLHGFPQSWYSYRELMPELLPGRTVIAVDLPGLGDSTGELPAHDKRTLARYVHELLVGLGYRTGVQLVAHDFGGGLAFALVTRYRDQFDGLLLMDFPVVGRSLSFAALSTFSFHFAFFQQDPLAEQLLRGRERPFLEYFTTALSPADQPIPAAALDEYTRVYSRPGVLEHGMRWYRAWPRDEQDNAEAMAEPLTIPVRILTQEALLDTFLTALRDAAPHATGRGLAGTGHWIPEERPAEVVTEIQQFFSAQGRP